MSRACLLEQIKHELHQVESSIGIEMLVLTCLDVTQSRRMAQCRNNDVIVGVLPYIKASHPLHFCSGCRVSVNLNKYTMELK